jgi:hypothetical protein
MVLDKSCDPDDLKFNFKKYNWNQDACVPITPHMPERSEGMSCQDQDSRRHMLAFYYAYLRSLHFLDVSMSWCSAA